MRQATKQRQQRVLSQLLDRKHVSVNDLAGSLGISEATVRRDLRALSETQQLTLVHGGATLNHQTTQTVARNDFSFHAKHDRNLQAKQIIVQLAAALVSDGQQLFLDSGTTSFEMAPHLATKRGLSVVLNSARLALELRAGGNDLNIILLGGQFRPDRMDTVGPIALANLEPLRGFTTFIGADGLSMNNGSAGLSSVDIDSAHINRLAIQNANQTVLLVDHTKFQSAALYPIVTWEKIQHVVTNEKPSDEWTAFLHARNIQIHFPT